MGMGLDRSWGGWRFDSGGRMRPRVLGKMLAVMALRWVEPMSQRRDMAPRVWGRVDLGHPPGG